MVQFLNPVSEYYTRHCLLLFLSSYCSVPIQFALILMHCVANLLVYKINSNGCECVICGGYSIWYIKKKVLTTKSNYFKKLNQKVLASYLRTVCQVYMFQLLKQKCHKHIRGREGVAIIGQGSAGDSCNLLLHLVNNFSNSLYPTIALSEYC